MAQIRVNNLGGLNLYTNPSIPRSGDLIRSVNVISEPFGAKSKRHGYITKLGTADGSVVNSLFSWTQGDGDLFLYRASGVKLWYSINGTGAWTVPSNGTIASNSHVRFDVLGETLVIADGAGSTRYTTSGTAFTDATLAPVSNQVTQFQNRIYVTGTASTEYYSVTDDATNWNTTGSSDSNSFTVPGEGKNLTSFKQNNQLNLMKTSGQIYRWDGYALTDTATTLGASSPNSIAQTEDYYFWLNRLGVFGYGGGKPQLISNAVQPLIYNNAGSGIAGGTFDVAAGNTHRYDYFLSIGSVSEDYAGYDYPDCILKYDYQKNEFLTWRYPFLPTAWHSYKDKDGVQQLIFGSSGGQCFTTAGTALTDNGTTIEAVMEFIIDCDKADSEKSWRYITLSFNPGCEAKVQIAYSNIYHNRAKKWVEIGSPSSGIVDYRFPQGSQSKLLFVRIYEASKDTRFTFYGYTIDFEYEKKP